MNWVCQGNDLSILNQTHRPRWLRTTALYYHPNPPQYQTLQPCPNVTCMLSMLIVTVVGSTFKPNQTAKDDAKENKLNMDLGCFFLSFKLFSIRKFSTGVQIRSGWRIPFTQAAFGTATFLLKSHSSAWLKKSQIIDQKAFVFIFKKHVTQSINEKLYVYNMCL